MRRAFIAFAALAAALPVGCVAGGAGVLESTRLDEQAALSVELAYQASATAMLIAQRAGRVSEGGRERLRLLDERAYRAVQDVRRTYDAGNAGAYHSSTVVARGSVRAMLDEVAR